MIKEPMFSIFGMDNKIPTQGKSDPRRITELEPDILGVTTIQSENGQKTILFSNNLMVLRKIYDRVLSGWAFHDIKPLVSEHLQNPIKLLAVLSFQKELGNIIPSIKSDKVFGNYIEWINESE